MRGGGPAIHLLVTLGHGRFLGLSFPLCDMGMLGFRKPIPATLGLKGLNLFLSPALPAMGPDN